MNRTIHNRKRDLDWALLGERAFFGGLLLAVATAFYGAFSLSTTAAPIDTTGMIRQSVSISTPSNQPGTLATIVTDGVPADDACVCTRGPTRGDRPRGVAQ